MFVTACLLTLSLIVLRHLWIRYRFHFTPEIIESARHIPGPKLHPLLGNANILLGKTTAELFKTLRSLAHEFYDQGVYRLWAFETLIVTIFNAEDVQVVLSDPKSLDKDFVYKYLRWLGDGLLLSTGEKWHRRRKLLTPAFHFQMLKRFIPSFNKHAKEMVRELDQHCGETVDVTPFVMKTSLHSLCETIMGLEIDEKCAEKIDPYKNAIYEMGPMFVKRVIVPWLRPEWIFELTSYGKRFNKLVTIAHDFTLKVIQDRKAARDREAANENVNNERVKSIEPITTDENEDDNVITYGNDKTFLDILLSNLKEKGDEKAGDLVYESIREEVDTFMFEGHDTTAVSACFTLLCLANHPECQEKIYKEVSDVMGKSSEFSFSDLAKLNYLELCIKESLRMYPSVPKISRSMSHDVQFKTYKVLKDVILSIDIYDLHRNPKYWPDPDQFIPERFTIENSNSRKPFSYIPFSAGLRNCIGQKYAMLELKVFMAYVVRHFRIETVDTFDSITIMTDIVLRTKNGIKMKFYRR